MRAHGDHVLYWMIAARRSSWSFALDHALARARELGRPLLVLEPLRAGYRWASDRHHAFVLDGMADNAKAFAAAGITYLAYIEPEPGAGKGLLEALAERACCVVTDEQPGFFLPRMVRAAAARLPIAVETVDGCGVFPLRAFDKAFTAARWFRRAWQAIPHLSVQPERWPLARAPRTARDAEVVGTVLRRWPSARDLASIPIDHGVAPAPYRGGSAAAKVALEEFVARRATRYAERSHPDADAASGLSPYLHFGHISAHEVFARVDDPGFRDELVTWRELAHNFCFHRADHDRYAALPAWARATLAKHADDPRPERYTARELEDAATGDAIWNAAQRQLLREGRIHNYLRMLWGKKILEWSATPQRAFATMVELNNKYAVDGRDPNSYAGILWTLGLFDRPWGPERAIFGTVRFMSSAATKRKLKMTHYLAKYS
ncbi:MAG TPA: deoxyribodipyrimidine photolyase [Kofleriaceae bacterium]|nr:deoxyribodipyrimidine photolyase [Kofleriaceae bacterium]